MTYRSRKQKYLCGNKKKIEAQWPTVPQNRNIHIGIKKVEQWNEEDSVYYITKEKDITLMSAIRKIHSQLNHKKEEQMKFA